MESEFLDQLRRAVLIGIARRGVRWGLRVSNLSPLAPGEGGAGLKLLLSHHSRPVLQSLCPGSLLGKRSLNSALAVQREESFKRNPQKRELWESWRCIYSLAPRAQKRLLLVGSLEPGWEPRLVSLAVRAAPPPPSPGEEGVSNRRLLSPQSSEGNIFVTCLCPRPPHANTPGHLARLHSFAVEFPTEIRKSV